MENVDIRIYYNRGHKQLEAYVDWSVLYIYAYPGSYSVIRIPRFLLEESSPTISCFNEDTVAEAILGYRKYADLPTGIAHSRANDPATIWDLGNIGDGKDYAYVKFTPDPTIPN
jgi:hypothetical protein